ncbi:short-chain dehydrogenase/oxidoreductase [Aspergillus steynii IBT 23096]|uniref:Short-chain dehydrogenase/oxidoreductase n=1 Tax=Aspergillus steynii IBT 23096 TaxID=1392250 RepID=A0A2I2FWI7_9EURO|nr:short-chain dehydrogenase/oxidoreductase [Aspergillus steynii IBT 23096]PLB45002.1 short-chain dehydrogenase/oxidoreductase [Aspergillus steynii IBT 23096]
MSFEYKKVLVIGATSGIGQALAAKLVENGVSVIVSGRRQENLNEFVQKYGGDEKKVQAKVFDALKLDQIPQFASEVIASNPDLDCIFINSGIQRAFDFAAPESVDMDIFEQELTTNYTSAVHLTKAFLPHLQSQASKTAIAFTSSQMALVPMMRCPNYGASKAALHHFILALRTQVQSGPGDVKIVEIFPPAVQTELHDTKHQPDLKDGHLIGMPLEDFTDETWGKLCQGDDQIPVGPARGIFEAFEIKRQEMYHQMTELLSGLLKQFLR